LIFYSVHFVKAEFVFIGVHPWPVKPLACCFTGPWLKRQKLKSETGGVALISECAGQPSAGA
jgi:hypothetical protein